MKRGPAPLMDRDQLAGLARARRGPAVRLGLCNGAFDLLHVGHVRYLEDAARQCDVLLVAVNSDASVRASKGPSRPVVPESERAEMVAALACVDAVHVFGESTVSDVIRAVQPDFHFKGTDYTAESVPEGDLVRALGGVVVIAGDPKDHSTTSMVARLKP